MAFKRKTGDVFVVHGGQELQPLPKTSAAKKLRVNPPRKARMSLVAETPMSEPVVPKKTRKKEVANTPQAGPSQPAGAKKQRKTAEEVEALVELKDGWLDRFLTMTTDDLARLLGEIANHGKVKTSAIKKARTGLPSFSGAKWRLFAETFGFPATLDNELFERVSTPVYWLPPSIHEIMFEAAWRTQDVYQERQVQRREEARVRIMDPYLVRIVGLFQGRVIDKPEEDMLETEYASGGEVEHEIFMVGGILFFIAKFKLYLSLEDNVTQLFLEMLSAARLNKGVEVGKLRIYGLLTDLIDFHFYSYDPLTNNFAFDETLVVNVTRDVAFTDMIPVANKIFSVILTAYIDGLEATLKRSSDRIKGGAVSSPGSAPVQPMRAQNSFKSEVQSDMSLPPMPSAAGRKSTYCWETALLFAQQCRDKFKEKFETVEDAERNSTEALEMLAKSVRSIPRASRLTGRDDPSSLEEIQALAHRKVHKKLLDICTDHDSVTLL